MHPPPGVTITGTHGGGLYGIYGSADMETWTGLDTEIGGSDDAVYWDNCDLNSDAPAYFFTATVEDNPDGDEWTTGHGPVHTFPLR